MKYEGIKVGDVFTYLGEEETVVYKNDKYRFITTINYEEIPTTWAKNELDDLKPIKEELLEEGLLVSKLDSLVYKLSDGWCYGFVYGCQSDYFFNKSWDFSIVDHWRKATKHEEEKFIEMLKKECEARGLFEDTKIECHADEKPLGDPDFMGLLPEFDLTIVYNKNGKIFHKGKFAKPRKEEETTLELVTKAVQEIEDFTIEQTESGIIILTPMKK